MNGLEQRASDLLAINKYEGLDAVDKAEAVELVRRLRTVLETFGPLRRPRDFSVSWREDSDGFMHHAVNVIADLHDADTDDYLLMWLSGVDDELIFGV